MREELTVLCCLIQLFKTPNTGVSLSQDTAQTSLWNFDADTKISPLVWDCRGSLPFGSPSELLAFCTSWVRVSVQFLFTFSICPYLPSNLLAKPCFCFPAGLSLNLSSNLTGSYQNTTLIISPYSLCKLFAAAKSSWSIKRAGALTLPSKPFPWGIMAKQAKWASHWLRVKAEFEI